MLFCGIKCDSQYSLENVIAKPGDLTGGLYLGLNMQCINHIRLKHSDIKWIKWQWPYWKTLSAFNHM